MVIIIIIILTGCTSTKSNENMPKIKDTGITNLIIYENYEFWNEPNQLTVYTNPNFETVLKEAEAYNFNDIFDVPFEYKNKITKLKNGIISYFEKEYNLDVSEKLNKQKIRVFSVNNTETDTTMGGVDPKNRNVLNLNQLLFTEYSDYFKNTYVHESLHQIGFINMQEENFVDGLVDAYTDLILCDMGEVSIPTPSYSESRILAYPLILVDKELPSLYLAGKFSIAKRITNRLKNIERTDTQCEKPGDEFIKFTKLLYANNQGLLKNSDNDPAWYAFDAQSIVYSYVRTFDLTHEQIDYIRQHYLFPEFESQKKEGVNYIE